jgi:hypothetical protein
VQYFQKSFYNLFSHFLLLWAGPNQTNSHLFPISIAHFSMGIHTISFHISKFSFYSSRIWSIFYSYKINNTINFCLFCQHKDVSLHIFRNNPQKFTHPLYINLGDAIAKFKTSFDSIIHSPACPS